MVSAEYACDFLTTCFPTAFGSHLEFLCKTQKHIYLRNGVRQSDFVKNFDPQGIRRVYWQLFLKMVFSPFLAAILNFCVKHKNAFISETVPERAISTKFLSTGDQQSLLAMFLKNSLPANFGSHLEFLCKKHL